MLPSVFNDWIIYRPVSRNDKKIKRQLQDSLARGISQEQLSSMIITKDEASEALKQLNIRRDSVFYEFYMTFKSTGGRTL